MALKIKTNWDLKLLYKSDTDPQIEKDIKIFDKAVAGFEKKYKNSQDYLSKPDVLLNACQDYEKISFMPELYKPQRYFSFKRDLDSKDKVATARSNDIANKYSAMGNRLIFFRNSLGKVSKDVQENFLQSSSLSKYHYFLKNVFDNAQYELSEAEEKILNLMRRPARTMWVSGFNKVLSNQEIKFKGKILPISEASSMIPQLKTKERRELDKSIKEKVISISDFAESELNAVFTNKKIRDELRGYKKPYSSTVKQYENEDKTVENVISAVTENFHIAHRFYKIKAKLLKEKRLKYCDRAANVGESKTKFNFNDSVKIVRSAFAKFDKKYADIFDSYLEKGQIDVAPKKGKKAGAYCASTYGLPTFVLLNHVNDLNSLMTLGHEMGHSFHSEMSFENQPPVYSDYSTSVAEAASTLFENFVFDEVFEKLSDKEKIVALHDKINSSVSTIFRQIACFNFELETHNSLREKGYLAKEEFADIMKQNMKSYLGPVFDMEDSDGYAFVSWPHIRNHFYVYSYAFGEIISSALYSNYKKDKNFIKNIEKFLSAGNSKKPEDIFKDAGLDIRKKDFFVQGLKKVEEDIKKLEKLVG